MAKIISHRPDDPAEPGEPVPCKHVAGKAWGMPGEMYSVQCGECGNQTAKPIFVGSVQEAVAKFAFVEARRVKVIFPPPGVRGTVVGSPPGAEHVGYEIEADEGG